MIIHYYRKMSLSKFSSQNGKSVSRLLKQAQTKRMSISTELFSERLVSLVNSHANAIGVPPEFILWPLLTATASFIGTNGHVSINCEWMEPAIMWFVVAARKGEKKTAALRRIRKPIEELEKEIGKEWVANEPDDKSTCPQLIVDHFSFEELHSIMSRSNGQVLGCFDEMCSFYGQLDLYKHSSTMDRNTLLTLNGGGPWTRNFKSYTGSIPKTAFNVTGFIQPAFVFDMLHSGNDVDGLNDRQLFDFPPEREMKLDELQVPMPADTPDLKNIFIVLRRIHSKATVYTLEDEAYELFRDAHDKLSADKEKATDENMQGILSKSKGYCARIAMILHCLEQAICICDDTSDHPWTTIVSPDAVRAATAITMHFNLQKFIALGLASDDGGEQVMSNRMVRLLSMDSKQGNGVLNLSDISQKHISEKVGSSYPIHKAVELIEEAEQLGFGTVVTTETANKRIVKRFRKRPLSELNVNWQEALKKSKVCNEKYTVAFHPAASCGNVEKRM